MWNISTLKIMMMIWREFKFDLKVTNIIRNRFERKKYQSNKKIESKSKGKLLNETNAI